MSYPDRDPQLVYDLASNQLTTQIQSIDAMDTKIATLLSLASALLGIAAAVFALHTSNVTKVSLTSADSLSLAVGVAVYIVIAFRGIRSYFCRDWDIGPQPLKVWDQLEAGETDQKIKWDATNDLIYAFEENLVAYFAKKNALTWVFVGVAVETVVLFAAIYLVAKGA